MSTATARSEATRCPFLREAQVKFCRASVHQKMIVRPPGGSENERCSSGEYVNCPVARQYQEETPTRSHCPFLQESLMQYCSAASVTKYIPWTESSTTRCGSSSFRFCDLYLSLADPRAESLPWSLPDGGEDPDLADVQVGDIRMPKGIRWAANHMWLHEADDGSCHVGVDQFLTRILGKVEDVSFPAVSGLQRPAAVLHVNGVDFPMIFPTRLFITSVNSRIRIDPKRMVEDPYRQGWLVEGRTSAWGDDSTKSVVHGLLSGRPAAAWMKEEVERVDRFIHDELAVSDHNPERLVQDGGHAVDGAGSVLGRESLLRLFNEFFSPCEGRRGAA